MFNIMENSVMTVKEVPTKKQTAIIREFYCYKDKALLVADKNSIIANGIDIANISCKWQMFNIETGVFEDNIAKTDAIKVEVDGTLYDVADGLIEFTSLEPGQHIIKSVNELAENTELVVVAV